MDDYFVRHVSLLAATSTVDRAKFFLQFRTLIHGEGRRAMICTQVRFTQNVSSRVFSGQSYSRCRGFIGGYDLPNELSTPSLPPSMYTWSPAITSFTVRPSESLVFGTLHLCWRARYKADSDRLQIKFLLNGHEHLSPFSRLTFFYHLLFKNWAYGLSPVNLSEAHGCPIIHGTPNLPTCCGRMAVKPSTLVSMCISSWLQLSAECSIYQISGYESRARSGCINKETAVYIYLVSNTGYRGLARGFECLLYVPGFAALELNEHVLGGVLRHFI